jgi:hypothetical protein
MDTLERFLMPEKIFLPYEYADGALEIHMTSATTDDTEIRTASMVDPEARTIGLCFETDWERADLQLKVLDPNEQIGSALLEGEILDSSAEVMLIVRGSESRFRRGIPLVLADGGWSGSLSLMKHELRGGLDLEAVAVRVTDGVESAGKAFRRGERIGCSERWRLHIDETVPMPGGAIDGEWRNFAIDDLDELKSRPDCAWYLDISRRDRPRIFFNEGIEGLRPSLEISQNSGTPAYVRNVLTHSLLQPILMALAVEAIASAPESSIDELTGWTRKLLLQLAKQCHHATEEATVETWLAGWKAEDRAKIVADLSTAIQRHLDLGKGIKSLVTSLENRQNE